MRGRQNLVGQVTNSGVEEDEVHKTEPASAIEGLKDRIKMLKAGKQSLCFEILPSYSSAIKQTVSSHIRYVVLLASGHV